MFIPFTYFDIRILLFSLAYLYVQVRINGEQPETTLRRNVEEEEDATRLQIWNVKNGPREFEFAMSEFKMT